MPDIDYDVVREGDETILRVNCEKWLGVPSLEDSPITMARTCDLLIEVRDATKVVFSQRRDYEYDYKQTRMLTEIALLYNRLVKEKELISYEKLGMAKCMRCLSVKHTELKQLIFETIKSDPLGCYVNLKRMLRKERIELDNPLLPECVECEQKFISVLNYIIKLLQQTQLIKSAEKHLAGFKVGDRSLYRQFFTPNTKPDFMYTKLMAAYPQGGEELDNYSVNGTEISIFKLPDTVQTLYHMTPPEFRLSEEKYELLDLARKIMAEHKPGKEEYVNPERMRQVFYNVGHDLIEELAKFRSVRLSQSDMDELTQILVRYTVGFGLIEVLLSDEKIQDVTINSPMGHIPMFIVHGDYGDCITNVMPTPTEAESWASKLRMISGRPLDEANPILDTEIDVPGARARIGVISPPLNPTGLAYAFRRHRDKPWTLPLFVHTKMIDPMAAGLMSFLVDGNRTMLVAGTRSAGKTSLLASLLIEIMRRYRIITIEDTLELPTQALRTLGYNIQAMKVASALTRGTTEVPADEGIRTTLRLGDSALIVGEIRSTEAAALYEAMRVGALANVVAGTIHGDSPYGVYDRVVNDLKVPKTSFKATDVVVVANPIKSPDGLHKWRRVTQITEVRKHWEDDPMLEHGFVDLMKYDAKTDSLQPSDDLINGDSDILKSIAGSVKDWAGNWDAVWENIELRAKIKQSVVDYAVKANDLNLLEAGFVILTNDEFHKLSDSVKEEVGSLDNKRIFFEWNEWMKRAVKKYSTKRE
ncbi:ATPase, T2SS/T4P/T4SS family [Nanoarchaeota archaeon]